MCIRDRSTQSTWGIPVSESSKSNKRTKQTKKQQLHQQTTFLTLDQSIAKGSNRLFGLIIAGTTNADAGSFILNEDYNLLGYDDKQAGELVQMLRNLSKEYMSKVGIGSRYCFWGENYKCYALVSLSSKLAAFLFAERDYVDENAFYLLETALGYFETNVGLSWKLMSSGVNYEIDDITKVFRMYTYPNVEDKPRTFFALPRASNKPQIMQSKAATTDEINNMRGGSQSPPRMSAPRGGGPIVYEEKRDSCACCFRQSLKLTLRDSRFPVLQV
eukprot:TRINITY_DN4292_c0_g1_i1.p1 TRINITY_DN4292_c0_g1~~TRINITY_DN4292_c0_g1_i1.p1  ORF type:complete len:295 (-),score=57.77 TRINITY_DN4292_c0_g1_i1:174-992(-)